MAETWEWDDSLYAQSASYYASGRLAYSRETAAQIVAAAGISSKGRALDVGCGPGSLTLVLAPFVGQIVGLDVDGGMIAEAQRQADRAGIGNVTWRQLRAEDLPADLGDFDLITLAQSLHWMARVEVLRLVRQMLRPGGACVHVHATTHRGDDSSDPLPRPRPPYREIGLLVSSFLGTERRAGRSVRPSWPGGDEDDVYRAADFDSQGRFTVTRGEVIERRVDDIVAATFSLSSSTPHLFAERRTEFETQLRYLLDVASEDGRFCERVRDVEFDVWCPRSEADLT